MTTTKEQVRDHGSGTRRAGPDRPTLRFFYSPTSGPSRRVEGFLAQVLQRRQNHRTFELQRVNCDKHPELVERYAVTQMPTLIVIEGRRVLGRLEGSCGCREIEKLLEPWLNRGRRPHPMFQSDQRPNLHEPSRPRFLARAVLRIPVVLNGPPRLGVAGYLLWPTPSTRLAPAGA